MLQARSANGLVCCGDTLDGLIEQVQGNPHLSVDLIVWDGERIEAVILATGKQGEPPLVLEHHALQMAALINDERWTLASGLEAK